jgi:hypothetical protein
MNLAETARAIAARFGLVGWRLSGRPSSTGLPAGVFVLYEDQRSGHLRIVSEANGDRDLEVTSTNNHHALANLSWVLSGHTGTAGTVAGFGLLGVAAIYQIGTDLQGWSANLDTLSGYTPDDDATLAASSSTRLPTQAAVKSYVDNALSGLSWKASVVAATTTAGTLASSFENGDTIDGVTLATGDRILIKDQVAGTENGIYVVNASGAPTRASDANTSTEMLRATVLVEQGTTNGATQWTCTNSTITLGLSALVFAQISGAGTYTAGSGLTLSGNQFSANFGTSAGTTMQGNQAAGGDASGTLPSLTITRARGLRESGGTTLPMGAVSEGQYLQVSGGTIIGVSLAVVTAVRIAATDSALSSQYVDNADGNASAFIDATVP